MEYRTLGTAGVKVSAVGLGGNTFGRFIDEPGSIAVIHRALELGLNHIDTANVYIDLYYCHAPDPSTPLDETLRALDDLVSAGKVRYPGCSNYPAWQMCHALWISDKRGYAPFCVVQSRYNLLDRDLEREVVPFCRWSGVGIIPYSPLAGGFLTGKYRPGQSFEPGMRGYNNPNSERFLTDMNWRIVGRLAEWAEARGHTPGELAVAWLVAHREVPSVTCGATRPEQVEANVRAGEWRLSAEELAEIERICAEA